MFPTNIITLFGIVSIFRNGRRGEFTQCICYFVEAVTGPRTLTAVRPSW